MDRDGYRKKQLLKHMSLRDLKQANASHKQERLVYRFMREDLSHAQQVGSKDGIEYFSGKVKQFERVQLPRTTKAKMRAIAAARSAGIPQNQIEY